MQIIEFTADSLRFVDAWPAQPPADGFVWAFLGRDAFGQHQAELQRAAQRLGGSALLDLHCRDLASAAHPSVYDYTSVYDLVIFRRLATQAEALAEAPAAAPRLGSAAQGLPAFGRIQSRAVGFVVFDRLLISVHPQGCTTAKAFIERFLSDAQFSLDAVSARSRLPLGPADLLLRMVNTMVDSYLDLRNELTQQLDQWQAQLLRPGTRFTDWGALMGARSQLQVLEDLCDEQRDAMQEWLDSLREQTPPLLGPQHAVQPADPRLLQAQHDQLMARARDVIEHIERVVHHARRLEQSAETVVQIHFSAQSNRTNDIMRTLTALTAIFLPLNLITGFFGMNFEFMPLLHHPTAFWWTLALMLLIVLTTGLVFWRKRYIARSGR